MTRGLAIFLTTFALLPAVGGAVLQTAVIDDNISKLLSLLIQIPLAGVIAYVVWMFLKHEQNVLKAFMEAIDKLTSTFANTTKEQQAMYARTLSDQQAAFMTALKDQREVHTLSLKDISDGFSELVKTINDRLAEMAQKVFRRRGPDDL